MTDACFDAEVLAAWAEGTLDKRAAAGVERHAAECARCQAMLAAFVRTEPAVLSTTPAVAPWWQSIRLRWLVPIAAAATAVAIWVALPELPRPATQVALAPERAVVDAAGVPPASPAEATAPAVSEPGAPVALRAPAVATDARSLAKESDLAREEKAGELAAPRQRGDAPESTTERRVAELPLAAAQTGAARADAQTVRSADAQDRGLADARVGNAAGSGFISRDGATRWRLAGAAVERSADGGATWASLSLPGGPAASGLAEAVSVPRAVGATAPEPARAPASPRASAAVPPTGVVAAGDAPSASVCWLVGSRGAVWLTTDGGQSFRRLAVPGDPDLGGVSARDARSADVSASDGRVFRTEDGGATWVLRP